MGVPARMQRGEALGHAIKHGYDVGPWGPRQVLRLPPDAYARTAKQGSESTISSQRRTAGSVSSRCRRAATRNRARNSGRPASAGVSTFSAKSRRRRAPARARPRPIGPRRACAARRTAQPESARSRAFVTRTGRSGPRGPRWFGACGRRAGRRRQPGLVLVEVLEQSAPSAYCSSAGAAGRRRSLARRPGVGPAATRRHAHPEVPAAVQRRSCPGP